ncbi:hypothetical protein A9995_07745 [Erythrobacter sp. QSSC1-22B]|uniref:DUF3857 domain-containing protein n=1 Tax=Erythrobacter sp. QSSC1-22B TaxID=1860125 RepID=UPI000804C311|nr:DUF3857 domain-containing protein [Erythrobacter sp. QSSC1-22B]OBX19037.1 hypothetical protein A9995_07745 [Erythrobacter sp. QSSC1-22B]
MHFNRVAAALATSCAALAVCPAYAGEVPLYDAPPSWVEVAELDELRDSRGPLLLAEKQVRLEEGRLWVYSDFAIRLDSPEALTQMGTLQTGWLPDKGDLTVHRVELLRGDEVIDVLAQGSRFEVLRRESRLEQRELNGMLTATMPLSGAQIGDVLRLTTSTTVTDQALGRELQWTDQLMAEPIPLESGRVIVSWPDEMDIQWKIRGVEQAIAPQTDAGYRVIDIALPLPKAPETPDSAPFRFLLGPMIQATSFADYAAVSAVMAPHYRTAGAIPQGAPLADEVARIAAQTADPLERAAIATRLVQDQISYLANGMAGGNYLPQSPQETWELRYGDCKAKTFLLLAMLHELGIESEAALVRSSGGDAVPDLLPMASSFDHIIVRAEIAGRNYWLDGTRAGTRLANIDEVPRFHHALPVREGGAELVELDERPQSFPDQTVRLTLDQSAGVAVPALFEVEIVRSGSMGAALRSTADLDEGKLQRDAIENVVGSELGPVQMVDYSISYDDEPGLARITAKGVMTSPWQAERGIYEFSPPAQVAAQLDFNAARGRAEWRDIPIRLNGPYFGRSDLEVILPEAGEGFTLRNGDRIAADIGGVEVRSDVALSGQSLTINQSRRSHREELPASELTAVKRQLAQHLRALPIVRAPETTRRPWDYAADRSALAALEQAYATLIEDAEDFDSSALINRASFRRGTFDHEGSIADYDEAIAMDPTTDLYLARASGYFMLGDYEAALEDYRMAEDTDPDGSTYSSQIELLGLLGRGEEARTLAEDYADFAQAPHHADEILGVALGWAGDAAEGTELIHTALAARPGDGNLLNTLCWESGKWNLVTGEVLETCVAAVEKSDYSPSALDSRALAQYRLGNYEAALADANAALGEYRQMPDTRFLKGLILIAMGDRQAGQASIAEAKVMKPSVERQYAVWGLTP